MNFRWFYQGAGMLVMGLFPGSLLVIGIARGLVEIPLATVAGAWLYREES